MLCRKDRDPPATGLDKDELGRWGESRAIEFLEDEGFDVLDRNWRCREGEVDIVARDGDCLVVVEVKTRRSAASGHPLEAVSRKKLGNLRLLAALWLRCHDVLAAAVRIDVVAVLAPARAAMTIDHVKNVTS